MASWLVQYRYFLLVWVGTALVLSILSLGYQHVASDFQWTSSREETRKVVLPYVSVGNGPNEYRFSGQLVRGWFSPSRIQIIGDDRIESVVVNGQNINLDKVPESSRRDVKQGFALSLSEALERGANTVEVTVRDFGGNFGLSLNPAWWDIPTLILKALWVLMIALPLWLLSSAFKVPAWHRAAYLLILFGNVVQVWYIFTYNPVDHIWSDPERHWSQGIDILRTDLMSLTDPVGYQVYIAVLGKLSLKNPVLVAYFTSLLAVLNTWVWYKFLRELQANKTAALLGWAVCSLLPSWTAIYGYFMQETLMLPLLGASLWATWRCRRKADVRSFVLMVVLWMVAGLTRGIAIPLAAVACTWLWLAQDIKVKKALFSLVALLLLMGPLTYRSYQIVGHFAPHGMGHLNVIYAMSGKKEIKIHSTLNNAQWWHIFGSPSTGAKPFTPISDWHTQRKGVVTVDVDLSAGTRDWAAAKANLDFDFKRYLWITKESLIFIFFANSWPDNNFSRVVDVVGGILRWVWCPLFLAVMIASLVQRKKLRGNSMLMAMIGVWFVVQVLLPICINEGRYRKPLEGLLVAQIVLLVGAAKGQLRAPASQPNLMAQIEGLRRRYRRLPPEEGIS